VKNVAGYDLCKLHTGALGTLGIITQVTLKLRPIPEKQASMTWTCSVTELGPILDRLHHSATRPAYVEALGSDDRCELTVGFEECAAAVDWQIEQWHREFPCTNVTIREGDDAESHVQRAIDKLHSDGAWLWKASVRPSGVADFICNLPRGRFRWQAHTLSGIVWGQGRLDEEVSAVAHDLNLLQEQAARHSGSVIVWRCPVEWKAVLALWGRPRNDWELMRAIKRHMDPCGLFNPGRFVVS
jgi:glycolate oxidase FAD binding subunit